MRLLSLILLSLMGQSDVTTFVAPKEAQTLHLEVKAYTETQQGLHHIPLVIVPHESNSDVDGFTKCFQGPDVKCVPNGSDWACQGISPTQFAACRQFDYDADNDVDVDDQASFNLQYNRTVKPDARGVWVEINTGSSTEMQILADGIPFWEQIVDYIIVSTTPGAGREAMYAAIPATKPLVAGLKPTYFFQCTVPSSDGTHAVCDMNQPDAWDQYALWIQKLVDAVRSRTLYEESMPVFALENEDLFYATNITQEIDYDPAIVRAGLEKFPKDVMYYWYPSISSYLPERRAKEQALYEIAADVLTHVRFVDTNRARYNTIFEDFELAGVEGNQALINRDLVNMIYVYPTQVYWQDDQVPAVLEFLFKDKSVIFYPGQSGFVQQGTLFSQMLSD